MQLRLYQLRNVLAAIIIALPIVYIFYFSTSGQNFNARSFINDSESTQSSSTVQTITSVTLKPRRRKTNADFVACRRAFDDDFNRNKPYMVLPRMPLPGSLFLKTESVTISNQTLEETNLFIILMSEMVHPLTGMVSKNLSEVLPVADYDKWFNAKWQVHFPNEARSMCSAVRNQLGSGDYLKWTIILKCPALFIDDESIDLKVNLTSLDYPFYNEIGTNLRVCNFDLPEGKTKIKLAACTLTADNHFDRLPEWIEFHRVIGFEYFVIYVNQNSTAKYEKLLDVYINQEKVLTLASMFFAAPVIQPEKFAQQTAQNDCLHRLRGHVDWLALHDDDEFFQYYKPRHSSNNKNSLIEFLDASHQKNPSIGGVSFFSWFFGFPNISECNATGLYSRISSMRWRQTIHHSLGRYKAIVRPENVNYVYVHDITNGGPSDYVNPQAQGRMVHYRMPYIEGYADEFFKRKVVNDATMAFEYGDAVIARLTTLGFNISSEANC